MTKPSTKPVYLRLLMVFLLSATALVVLASCWLIGWPAWVHFRAVREIRQARLAGDKDAFDTAVRRVREQFGDEAAIPELIDALGDSDERFRRESAVTLGSIGRPAKRAVPLLVARLRDVQKIGPDEYILHALPAIGPQATPGLIDGLRDSDATIRKWSAFVLGNIGPDARDAIPTLIVLLGQDPNETVRAMAARALGLIDRTGKSVSALIDATHSESYGIQMQAETALGSIGPPAREAVPALTRLLDTHHDTFRLNVAHSLSRIYGFHECAMPEVIEAIRNPDSVIRIAAIRSLFWHQDQSEAAIPDLIQSLSDPDRNVRMTAAFVLSEFGELGNAAVPGLKRSLEDSDDDVRQWARLAIEKIQKTGRGDN